MFSPITNSEEERRELINSSLPKDTIIEGIKNCKDLFEFYHIGTMIQNGAVAQMQLFVLDNYKKVPLEEWNKHRFYIEPIGEDSMTFGKKDEFVPRTNPDLKSLVKREKERYEEAIKITDIEFVLDEFDGDFSVMYNKKPWAFIDDDITSYYIVIRDYLN